MENKVLVNSAKLTDNTDCIGEVSYKLMSL